MTFDEAMVKTEAQFDEIVEEVRAQFERDFGDIGATPEELQAMRERNEQVLSDARQHMRKITRAMWETGSGWIH